MIQLQILSGRQAGTQWLARRFPVRIGRSTASDLRLEDHGVWDEHLELTLDLAQGLLLTPQPGALVTVNRQAVQTAQLRNGDSIEIGSVQMRFWLAETAQRGLHIREWFAWTLIAVISLGEVLLIYWLLK